MKGGYSPSAHSAGDLNGLLTAAGLDPIEEVTEARFDHYLSLIRRWNARMNLTAIRESGAIASRHFVESIACAQSLPEGIGSLLDFGSGAGLPGIPITLCRREIAVTLAESQTKKAAFLQEVVRTLELNCRIWPRRAEEIIDRFDCVTMRAVDRMEQAVAAGAQLVRSGGWLAILTTHAKLSQIQAYAGGEFHWSAPISLPSSEGRLIAIASKLVSAL